MTEDQVAAVTRLFDLDVSALARVAGLLWPPADDADADETADLLHPRHQVTFASGETYPTAPDANVAYGIDNREYREAAHLQVTLDSRENITYIKILEG